MARESFDPYLALGVPPTATQAQITHAYRTRLRTHHPDTRSTPASRVADEELQKLLSAYALLRDPVRRAAYDEAAADSGVHVPITVRTTHAPAARDPAPPLWAGPVRRH